MTNYLCAAKAELKFEIILYLQNMKVIATDILVFSFLFISFVFFEAGADNLATMYNVDAQYSRMLMSIGYLIWAFSTGVLSISAEVSSEASEGYLFSKLTGVLPISLLYLSKFIARIFLQLMATLPIIIFTVFYWGFPTLSVSYILLIMLFFMICLIGMHGIGLVLASFTLYNRRLSRLSVLISVMLLFTGNAITYNAQLGQLLRYFPLNFAVDSARRIVTNTEMRVLDSYIFTFVCLSLFGIGMLLFSYSKNMTRQKGKLLWY